MNTEIKRCEHCENETECEETKLGHWFCSYECFEAFYHDEVLENEDFKSAKT